jgi:hypothetical protein
VESGSESESARAALIAWVGLWRCRWNGFSIDLRHVWHHRGQPGVESGSVEDVSAGSDWGSVFMDFVRE